MQRTYVLFEGGSGRETRGIKKKLNKRRCKDRNIDKRKVDVKKDTWKEGESVKQKQKIDN